MRLRKLICIATLGLCLGCGMTEAQTLPVPTPNQVEWQRMETIGFIHYNINTYTDMEWGYGNESPSLFNPTKLDCRQWARTFKEAGLKGIIFTAKHHDGFCLWPSAYTEHSVKNSPWKDGKGDLVREFVDACREYDLKVGMYLSPWDCNHPEYGRAGYITYFKNQLKELLTNYGELFEFWFDGANGGRGYYGTDSLHTRKIPGDYYPWREITDMVKKYQPNCIVHGGGCADIRWVGNEQGYAGEEHWSMMGGQVDPKVRMNQILMRGTPDGNIWLPSETDVSIRPGWYWHASEDHKLWPLSKFMNFYYESVGRNSLLLLNIPPNKEGLISTNDSLRLVQWHQLYKKELSHNLITKKMGIESAGDKKLKNCIDGREDSYWQAPDLTPVIEIDFKKELTFNRLMLREHIREGQRVKSFKVEAFHEGKWKPIAEETTIGNKRILRLSEITASRLRIAITGALAAPQISEIQLFYAETQLDKPIIKRRKNGMVYIQSANKDAKIYYTTDGTKLTEQNRILYQEPFMADGIQYIQAMAVDGKKKSETEERRFTHSMDAWTTMPANAANTIFDENENSTWVSPVGKKELIVDLAAERTIRGFHYLPDQARWSRGIAVRYEVEVSSDKQSWQKVKTPAEFSNIQNNPVNQEILFDVPVKARYFRLKALTTVGQQNNFGVAELKILID